MGSVPSGRRTRGARRVGATVLLAVLVACGSEGEPPPGSETTSSSPADQTTVSDGREDPTTSASNPDATGPGTLEHRIGFSLEYPEGWSEAGTSISTQFASGAECVSVMIVDQGAPSDSGQAGSILQSIVQVCFKTEAASLEDYLESIYGDGIPGFTKTELGGLNAYRAMEEHGAVIFVKAAGYMIQVTTSVVASTELEAERLEQVASILDSMRFG